MSNIKLWPHLILVGVLCAVLAGAGVAFYLRHQQNATAAALPNAARIQRVDGEVALNNSLDPANASNEANSQWTAAAPNQPFSVGDRIYTRDNSRASLAFTGRNFARLNPNSSLDVLNLAGDRTQLALRDGSALFDVGYLAPGEVFEVATPYGAVNFDEPGLYDVGLNDNGGAFVSVLSGLAQVAGLGGSGRIGKGEMLTLLGQTAAQVVLSRLDGGNAGSLVDDYYRYQYPNNYDGRYSNYDAYLNDPYYYDPYRGNVSYQYVNSAVPGVNDLDYYGDWQNVSGYGNAWRPRVDAGWVPYQQGSWVNDYPYGPTWVSSEPWGYAPYHYGRWANVGNQWYWIPESVNTTPVYAPALVAFVPLDNANEIGWVPLGPGDQYAPRYYDQNWQPYYLSNASLTPSQLINLSVPGAVTVVPVQDWNRVIDARTITRINPQTLAQVRPTLDPLTLTPLRNAVIHSAWGRGKIDLPPGIAKKLYETPVVTNNPPLSPPFRKDLAKALRVETVPDKVKGKKFEVRDERQDRQVQQQADNKQQEAARRQQVDALAAEAARGNRDAQRQQRELIQQQQQQQAEQAQAARRAAAQQAQGERVGHRAQPQPKPEVARPQMQPQPQPRVERHEMKARPAAAPVQPRPQPQPQPQAQTQPQSQPAAAPAHGKAGKQGPPAQPGGQGQGGAKGKGKGKP
jgi:hypothetical protein